MNLVFSSLAELSQPLRELAISNLQNVNEPDPERSTVIMGVLCNLRSLRLNVVAESDDSAPEHDLEVCNYIHIPSHPS